jgi:hypothetical protein
MSAPQSKRKLPPLTRADGDVVESPLMPGLKMARIF